MEKIITTFETTITWFDPSDLLPSDYTKVLITQYIEPYGRLIFTVFYKDKKFTKAAMGFDICDIDRWAYLPKFGDEE